MKGDDSGVSFAKRIMMVVKLSNLGLGINVIKWPLEPAQFARAAFENLVEVLLL